MPPTSPETSPITLRAHEPGDLDWVVQRHGAVYGQEYGWDERFRQMVALACADIDDSFDPHLDFCWIAVMNGERVGSIALTKSATPGVARLRILLVEPQARGHGLGTRLVEECIAFARRKGYAKIDLWTNSLLDEARHIYSKTGFVLLTSEPHHKYGEGLIAETWQLTL